MIGGIKMNLEGLREYLPVLIPLIVVQFALTAASLWHVLTHRNYKFGNRPLWVVLSFAQFIGPVVYFIFGRGEE